MYYLKRPFLALLTFMIFSALHLGAHDAHARHGRGGPFKEVKRITKRIENLGKHKWVKKVLKNKNKQLNTIKDVIEELKHPEATIKKLKKQLKEKIRKLDKDGKKLKLKGKMTEWKKTLKKAWEEVTKKTKNPKKSLPSRSMNRDKSKNPSPLIFRQAPPASERTWRPSR